MLSNEKINIMQFIKLNWYQIMKENQESYFFEKIITKRFTCRSYSEEKFSIEIIKEIGKQALMAPSADNRQAFRFFILEKKNYFKIKRLIEQEWSLTAPYIAILFSVPEEAYIRPYDNVTYDFIDAAIAFDHFILLLTEAGFGTAWTSANIDPKALIRALKLPNTWEFISFTPIGYPLEQPPKNQDRLRRRPEEMILTEPPSITQYLR